MAKEIENPEQEVKYIEEIAKNRDFFSFNNDPGCFYRYCSMQSGSFKRDGRVDFSDHVQDIASAVIGINADPEYSIYFNP